ncbi:MAG: hypothetical protein II876_00030 [Synergistaceae bacterium]|nr:hypothetical protein [Synergistaceae bacterium]MBR0279196.1 hypothetical protein [Synergistaceae bacterium]
MPGMRENMRETLKRKAVSAVSREYSVRSPIRKAYEAGQMPIDHKRLLGAIKEELGEGVKEGEIQLERVLQSTGYLRASALKMLHHMQNFGVLETKPLYRATWVKVLKDKELHDIE